MAEVGCPRQRRSGQRRAAEAETERFESIASSMGCALTHVKKYARCAQSAVIPVNGEAERHDGWLPPSVSGGRRQPEAVCGGQAAHGATRLHSARQRDVVRVLSHDWQACRHLLERCVKNQPSLVEKGVVCPCPGVWGVVLSWAARRPQPGSRGRRPEASRGGVRMAPGGRFDASMCRAGWMHACAVPVFIGKRWDRDTLC